MNGDPYAAVLDAFRPGLLVTFNGSAHDTSGTDELRVAGPGDDGHGLSLQGWSGGHYTVERMRDDGEYHLWRVEREGDLKHECEIITIEVVGVDD